MRTLLALTLLAALGCGRAAGTTDTAPSARQMARAVSSVYEGGETAQPDRQIARRASIDVEVERVAAARDAVGALARSLGGFVERSETRDDDGAEMMVRVPAASLDSALARVARLGRERRRVVGADDVTGVVVDLDARATNLRALRDRLRTHLERATTVADIVAVERELARVQSELDSLETHLQGLRSRVAMSELRVDLSRRVVLGPLGLVVVGAARLVGKLFVWR